MEVSKSELFRVAHGSISREILGAYFHVYNRLGYLLAEPIYQRAMPIALERRGLSVRREVPMPVRFEGITVGDYRADLVVENTFLVELKSVEKLSTAHDAQVYNYLRISQLPVALLLNFGPTPSYRRLVLPVRREA